jgi:hypothetical protein
MIKKQILAFLFIALSIVSCSKDEPHRHQQLHLHRQKEKAVNGEYNITGITSSVVLLKVILTKKECNTIYC